MNFFTSLKARNAISKLSKGDREGAMRLYEEAISEGLDDPRYILSYSVLLMRNDQYQKARELLVKTQNSPLLKESQKTTLYVNYAVCIYKLGETQKAIELLERQHAKKPCELIYETLGYLYVDSENKEKALPYNQEALAYDDDDPIVLDNVAQTYYRLLHDEKTAKEYFLRAIGRKATQIDTLYFLAKYDIAEGNKDAAREKLETILKGTFSPLNYATPEKANALLSSL